LRRRAVILASAGAAKARAIARLRALQLADGSWMGRRRGLLLDYAYGTALVHCGGDPRSEPLQDICDRLQSHQHANGGFAHSPEAQPQAVATHLARLLLRRCRPRSPAIAAADRFLAHGPRVLETPWLLLDEWVHTPEDRARILDVRPPARALRELAGQLVRRLGAGVGDPRAAVSGQAGQLRARARGAILQAMSWPLPESMDSIGPDSVPDAFGLVVYPSFLALQALGRGHGYAQGRERTERFVAPYLVDRVAADGPLPSLSQAVYVLLALEALNRQDDAARLRAAVARVEYDAGGWLRTPMAGRNVADTGLAVEALSRAGVPGSDPAVRRACDFLQGARRPGGAWPSSWEGAAPPGPRTRVDADGSAIAWLALQRVDDRRASDCAAEVLTAMRRLQHPSGGWGPVDGRGVCAAVPAASFTSRAACALAALGIPREHPSLQRALAWLLGQQRSDGTWTDPTTAGPVYGTALALDALVALGHREVGHPDVERAVYFVQRSQNADGGWGFDRNGARRAESSVEQTAWAVYALCTFSRAEVRPIAAIQAAIRFLVDRQRPDGDWDASDVGRADDLEGHYSSLFPIVFVLRAMAAYEALVRDYLGHAPRLVKSERLAERARERQPKADDP
jgi:prenyltransferase beta subunit